MIKKFKPDDLEICEWQYQITHHSICDFDYDDIVFLKSNPEWPLQYIGIWGHLIIVLTPEGNYEKFPPEVLLQYKYAALLIWRKRFLICLN